MTTRRLFDPLRYLLEDIRCEVQLNRDGRPVVGFRGHSPQQIQRARAVLARYERLLALQLREGGLSVHKLIARGLIRLEGRRYVLDNLYGYAEEHGKAVQEMLKVLR